MFDNPPALAAGFDGYFKKPSILLRRACWRYRQKIRTTGILIKPSENNGTHFFMTKKSNSDLEQTKECRSEKRLVDPRFFFPVLFLAATIVLLSNIPHLKFGFDQPYEQIARKTVHIIINGMLAALAWLSFPVENKRQKIIKAAICFLLLGVFAGFNELQQAYVPGRSGTLKGVLFDLAGIVSGICAMVLWEKKESVER